jgi:hypothetical protein
VTDEKDDRGKTDRGMTVDRGSGGRFAKGNGGPGRTRKGVPNRRTLAGRDLLEALQDGDVAMRLPSARARLAALLVDADPSIRLGAERLVLGLLYPRGVEPPALGDRDVEIHLRWTETLGVRTTEERDD